MTRIEQLLDSIQSDLEEIKVKVSDHERQICKMRDINEGSKMNKYFGTMQVMVLIIIVQISVLGLLLLI